MKIIKKKLISLIIPVYNEEKNLFKNLQFNIFKLEDILKNNFEIIIVNDGSTDNSCIEINRFKKIYPNTKIINVKKNNGIGNALNLGFKKSSGSYIFFNSCDLPYRYENFRKAIKLLETYDVIIFSRINRNSLNLWRKITSITWSLLTRTILNINFKDMTFVQIYPRSIWDNKRIAKFGPAAFSVELIYLARLQNMKIIELKSNFHKREFNEIKYGKFKDIILSFFGLIFIFFFNYNRKYK
jgi:glycosyltransferase involved in cell wall biosynthesis